MPTVTRPTDAREALAALLNTLDVDGGADDLAEPDGLRDLLVEHGLAPEGVAVSADDLDLARRLRGHLRAVAAAHAEAQEVAAGTVEGLNAVILEVGVQPRFVTGERVELVAPGGGVPAALAILLDVVVEAIGDGSWQRLKLCGRDTCRWAFWDGSRNRSGRWCSMAVCGNREKVKAYRERHAADGG